jgi:excisionase family DNA binding protein
MKHTLTSTQAAKLLGVTVKTLQRWDREGRLKPVARTKTNRRVYTLAQVRAFQGLPVTFDKDEQV